MTPLEKSTKLMRVVQAHRNGSPLPEAALSEGLSVSQVEKWVKDFPYIAEAYEDAKVDFNAYLAGTLLRPMTNAFMTTRNAGPDVKEAKVLSENIKWFLEKADPDKYGQRVKVEKTSSDRVIIEALSRTEVVITDGRAAPTISTDFVDITEAPTARPLPLPLPDTEKAALPLPLPLPLPLSR